MVKNDKFIKDSIGCELKGLVKPNKFHPELYIHTSCKIFFLKQYRIKLIEFLVVYTILQSSCNKTAKEHSVQ